MTDDDSTIPDDPHPPCWSWTTAAARYELLQACRVIARTDSLSVVRQDGIDRLKAENTRLRAQVEAVRWLHHRVPYGSRPKCDACWSAWPCPTIAALGEEEG
jgi:hypothetical protein